ncbi:MAG: DMT family transporter [Pseudomonadales bacterium]
MVNNWKIGLGFSLITALFWGLLPFALQSLLDQMDSLTITWYRFSAAALIAWLWYGRKNAKSLIELCRGPSWRLTLLAVACLAANYVLFLHGLNFITPAAAELVMQVSPLMLLLGSLYFFNEMFSRRQWLGVAIFTIGLLLFFHHRFRELVETDEKYLIGVGLTLMAAVLWTVYALSQKKITQQFKASHLLLLIYLGGSLIYLPFASPLVVVNLSGMQWAVLAFASLNTIIAYGSFGHAMSHWDASRVSAVITLAPLFTLGFGMLMHWLAPGSVEVEPMDALNWLGAVLVVVGSIMAALSASK